MGEERKEENFDGAISWISVISRSRGTSCFKMEICSILAWKVSFGSS